MVNTTITATERIVIHSERDAMAKRIQMLERENAILMQKNRMLESKLKSVADNLQHVWINLNRNY